MPIAGKDRPLVSIIVPMYNLETYIGAALHSLRVQSYSNIEILAVDDNSTDRTLEIVKQLASNDSRIRILTNQRASGASGTRNTGIQHAQGDWIAFLDGDDLLHQDSISHRVQSASRNPNTPFLSGDFLRFTEAPADAHSRESEYDPFWRQTFARNHNAFGEVRLHNPIEAFLIRHLTWTGSAFIRKDLMQTLVGFDETLPRSEDVHLWLRAAAYSQSFIFASKAISYYRQRAGSLSKTISAPDEYAVVAFRSLRLDPAFVNHSAGVNQCIRNHIHKNTYYYRKQKMTRQALSSALDGVASDPMAWFAWKNLIGSVFRL